MIARITAATCVLLLLSACQSKTGNTTDIDVPIGSDVFNTAMPRGQVTVPGHGKELHLAVGAVTGIAGFPANGVTTAHYFEDKSTIIGVQTNIAPAEDGSFYEAWAATGEKNQWTSLGHMNNLFNDSRHSTRFETPEDLSKTTRIVITQEADDGNPLPGEEIAEGILKPTKR